ncbi:MAG: hypothetical protein LBC20_04180 [Planctomycetaceae bacterium]|nr:hypothetical protein [Planctomycetaceae bacterium]
MNARRYIDLLRNPFGIIAVLVVQSVCGTLCCNGLFFVRQLRRLPPILFENTKQKK